MVPAQWWFEKKKKKRKRKKKANGYNNSMVAVTGEVIICARICNRPLSRSPNPLLMLLPCSAGTGGVWF
jgi:hypothetical protein